MAKVFQSKISVRRPAKFAESVRDFHSSPQSAFLFTNNQQPISRNLLRLIFGIQDEAAQHRRVTPKSFCYFGVFCTVWLLPIIKWNTRVRQSGLCVRSAASSDSLRMHCRRSCLHFAYFNRVHCTVCAMALHWSAAHSTQAARCVRRASLFEPLQWPPFGFAKFGNRTRALFAVRRGVRDRAGHTVRVCCTPWLQSLSAAIGRQSTLLQSTLLQYYSESRALCCEYTLVRFECCTRASNGKPLMASARCTVPIRTHLFLTLQTTPCISERSTIQSDPLGRSRYIRARAAARWWRSAKFEDIWAIHTCMIMLDHWRCQ